MAGEPACSSGCGGWHGDHEPGCSNSWQTGYDQGIAEKRVVQEKLDAAVKALKDIRSANHGEYGEVSDTEIDRIVNETLNRLNA